MPKAALRGSKLALWDLDVETGRVVVRLTDPRTPINQRQLARRLGITDQGAMKIVDGMERERSIRDRG